MSMHKRMEQWLNNFDNHHERISEKKFGKAYSYFLMIIGFILLITGILMIPFPGPGWLLVFASIAILATQFDIARKLLFKAAKTYDRFYHWVEKQGLSVKVILFLITTIFTTTLIFIIYYYLAPEFITNLITFLPHK